MDQQLGWLSGSSVNYGLQNATHGDKLPQLPASPLLANLKLWPGDSSKGANTNPLLLELSALLQPAHPQQSASKTGTEARQSDKEQQSRAETDTQRLTHSLAAREL